MDQLAVVLGMKTLFLFGFALWFSLAVLNNATDPGTNTYLIGQMMRMDLVKEDPNMGNGIEWRALSAPALHKGVLYTVILVQMAAAALLWIAVYKFAATWLRPPTPASIADATLFGNIGFGAFAAIWIVFWSGGMWFGYWMKTPQIQQVHMTLLIMSMVGFMVVNYPDQNGGSSLAAQPVAVGAAAAGGSAPQERRCSLEHRKR